MAVNFFVLAIVAFVAVKLTAEYLDVSSYIRPGMCDFLADTLDGGNACYFSESYWEARAKFRLLAKLAGAELTSKEVVAGDFTTDFAVFRGSGDGLVVHSSGVHGVEGYAGSGIQCAALHEIASATKGKPELLKGPTIVFIHAVNPYGMAHFRRFNENNVDLNRNGILPGPEWDELLKRDPNIANYEDFTELFNPPRPPTLYDAYIGYFAKALYNIATFGFVPLKRAIVTGQYHNPKGVYFAGRSQEASHKVVWDFLEPFANTKGVITWIDVHTGLGPKGVDTLLVETPEEGEDAAKWFEDAPALDVTDPTAKGDVAAGYDLSRGFISELYIKRFPVAEAAGRPAMVMGQEFGTLPGIFVARAMILENQAFQYDPVNQPYWVSNRFLQGCCMACDGLCVTLPRCS